MPAERVAIAGAGIAGLTAALALAGRGFHVQVFEKSPKLEEAGAGIQLSPNAMKVLAALGLGAALALPIVEIAAVVIRRGRNGRQIVRLPFGNARSYWGAPYAVIHRRDLQQVLLSAAGQRSDIDLVLGTPVEDVRQEKDRITFSGAGTKTAADVLIGADGLWSATRAAAGDTTPPTFAKRRAWRAVLPAAAAPAWLSANETGLALGPDAHLVHYPVAAGSAFNIVAVLHDENAGPGWSEPADKAGLIRAFAGWAAPFRDLLATPDDWRTWPLFDRPPGRSMATGRLALIGDAAHPMLPFLAQGGAMGIEDAWVLAAMLADGDGTIEERLAAFSVRRIERVARVQREAQANGARYHWRGPMAAARDFALARLGGERLLARYDWLYGWMP